MTAATPSHLHVYRRFGVQRILLANQLVDAEGLRFILSELKRDPDFALRSVEGFESVLEGATSEQTMTRIESL